MMDYIDKKGLLRLHSNVPPVLYTVALQITFWNMNSAIWAVGQHCGQ